MIGSRFVFAAMAAAASLGTPGLAQRAPANPLLGNWSPEQIVGGCRNQHLQFTPTQAIFGPIGAPTDVRAVRYRVVSPTSVEVTPSNAMPKLFTIRRDGVIAFMGCTFHRSIGG